MLAIERRNEILEKLQIEKKVKDLYEKEMTFGIDKTIFLYDDELAM